MAAEDEGLHFVATIDNKDFMRSITEIRDAVVKTSQLLERVAENTGKAGKTGTTAAQEAGKAIDKTDESLVNLNKDVKESSEGFGKLAKAAAGFFTLQAAKSFAEKVFAVRQEVESLQTSFRILVGDKDKADSLFLSIKEFAVSTPMQMKDLASAAQTMMGFGIPLEQIMQNLKAIGDVSMGDAQRFQGLALSFSQMSAAGKLMGQDLMQMINAGFNPLATISEKTGKSIGVLKDEMSKGAISADMVRQAFIDATSEGGKFHGMLEEQSKTLKGAYSNLEGAISDMLNSIGEKMQGTFTSAIDAATYLAKNYESVGKVILTVVAAFGAYKAALMVAIALQKSMALASSASAFISLAKSVTSAKDAMALFNLVTKASPIGLVLSAVAAAATAFALFGKKASGAEKMENQFNEATAKATAKVKALSAALDSASKTSKVAKDAARELKDIAEEYGIKLSDEAKKIGNETKLTEELVAKKEELIDAIRREAIERERANQQKQIEDDYASKIQEARENFVSSLSDDFSSQAKGIMSQLITDEDIERIGRVEAEIRRLREAHGEYSVEVADAERKRAAMTDELAKKLWNYSIQLGKTEGDETKYADAASNVKDALTGLLRATNESTVSQQNASTALAQATLATVEQIKVQDAAKASVETLASITSSLTTLWNSENHMTLKIHYDDSEIPDWMKGLTDEQLAKSLAARQEAVRGNKKVKYGSRTFGSDEQTVTEMDMLQSEQQRRNDAKNKPTTPAVTTTTKKPKNTPKKTTKTSTWNQAHANADAKEMLEDWKEEMTDLMADVQQDITDANIEILDESTEKTLQKLQEDENKEVEAILKQRRDLIEKRKELDKKLWEKSAEKHDKYDYKEKTDAEYAAMIEAEAPGLLGALGKRTKQITDSYKKQREELTKELAKQEREAMLSYLKEYGDMEQQRLAITKEYDAKIAEARKKSASDYEIASLTMERDKQLRELDTKAIEQKIDWAGVFSSLEGHTKEYLEGLRDQLQSILNAGELPADQMAVIQDKLREINAAISEQGTMFDYIGERARENARLQQEATDAQKELATAEKEQESAEANLAIAKRTGGKKDVILAESKLAEARDKTAKATAKAKAAEDAAARTSAQKIADTFADAAEWVNKYLGDLPELLGKLGLGDAGEKAQMGLDAVNNAAGAAADYASGNYVGAALKAFNALDNIGNIVGVGGLSDKTLEGDIEKLTQSNENLQKAIDALADELSEASILDVKDIYQQQKKMLAQTEKNYREMMSRSGSAYDSGFWGTGIGGSHSSNKNIDDALSASDWAAVSKAAGRTIRGASEFWNLSSKQMYQVMRDANAQWTEIMDKANDGTADAAKFMNEYIELWKKQEEIENQYKERLTSVSFDNVKSSFLSALSDMDKSASDFSQDFTKYLFDAVMNAQVGELLDKELKEWYDRFSDYMVDGDLTDAEIEALRQRWDNIVKEGVSMRDAISTATGYGSSSEGSATYNAAKSFTQEQGDILNGRLTAIQIHTAEGNAIGRQIAASLQAMEALVPSGREANTAVLEIRNMMIYTNSHLEDLVRYAKATYNDFGKKLENVIYQLDTKL